MDLAAMVHVRSSHLFCKPPYPITTLIYTTKMGSACLRRPIGGHRVYAEVSKNYSLMLVAGLQDLSKGKAGNKPKICEYHVEPGFRQVNIHIC